MQTLKWLKWYLLTAQHLKQSELINGQIFMVLSHPNDWMATKLIDAMCTAIKQPQQHSRYQVLLPHVTYTAANV